MKIKNIKKEKGFALLMAVIITSTLLLVTYALSNVSLKELLLSYVGKDSQTAFYAADTGVECALFWDTKNPRNPNGQSAFYTNGNAANDINCNGNEIINGVSEVYTVPTPPTPTTAKLGGDADGSGQVNSIFQFFINGNGDITGPCAIVRVNKRPSDPLLGEPSGIIITTIESRGYNTCDINNSRRLERALRTVY